MKTAGKKLKDQEKFIDEQPRKIENHKLLDKIYHYHDQLIQKHVSKPCLEIGFGTKPFTGATHGIEPVKQCVENSPEWLTAVQGSGHNTPYRDNQFESVVARRVIHHFHPELRSELLQEIRRVLKPGGTLCILEGTPGFYRRFVKQIGSLLGAVNLDEDEYGYLNRSELIELLRSEGFALNRVEIRGSPLMPLAYFDIDSDLVLQLYQRSQWIDWWTFIVATHGKTIDKDQKDGDSE